MNYTSDLYETPPELFDSLQAEIGKFTWDLCAEKTTSKCGDRYFGIDNGHDSLEQQWCKIKGWLWCNPPYSNPLPWIQKASEGAKLGAKVAMLLPSDTSTVWFHKYIYKGKNCKFWFLESRVRFLYNGIKQGSPKFGSIVAVFS